MIENKSIEQKLEELTSKLDSLEVKSDKFQEISLKLNTLESKSNFLESILFNIKDLVNELVPQIARLSLSHSEEQPSLGSIEEIRGSNIINLNSFKRNGKFSQNGEQGILDALYQYITPDGFVIEFGAADGIFCSNTAHIWSDKKTEALLIEADDFCFSKLKTNTENYENVKIEHSIVKNIDDYTNKVADVISIDIDGYDYFVALKMETKHKIVIIEYNPTVPPHVEMVPSFPAQGASARSITLMMEKKGYSLVACTKTNLFFLLGDHKDKFETRLEVLFDYSSLNYIVTTFNGLYQMVGDWGYGMESYANLELKSLNGNKVIFNSISEGESE